MSKNGLTRLSASIKTTSSTMRSKSISRTITSLKLKTILWGLSIKPKELHAPLEKAIKILSPFSSLFKVCNQISNFLLKEVFQSKLSSKHFKLTRRKKIFLKLRNLFAEYACAKKSFPNTN